MCAKHFENWLKVDKVIAKISRLTFWPIPCILQKVNEQSKSKTVCHFFKQNVIDRASSIVLL